MGMVCGWFGNRLGTVWELLKDGFGMVLGVFGNGLGMIWVLFYYVFGMVCE